MKVSFYASQSLLILLISLCTRAPAQDTILRQGFENHTTAELTYAPDVGPYGSGGMPTWNVVRSLQRVAAPAAGEFFWGARDVENTLSGRARSELVFDPGDICNLTSARFVFAYNVVGYDAGDDFGYVLYLDGFPEPEVVLVDGRNGGGASTDGWVYYTVAIPGTAQTARLHLFFDQNGDDEAGVDDVQLLATGDDGNCAAVCGVRLGTPTLHCEGYTDGADMLRLSLPYSGGETDARVYSSGGTVGGDDPGTVSDGTISVEGLREGALYLLQVSGGDCDLSLPIEVPAGQCAPSDLVINEVLADPGEDINGDGSINGRDEFVELYNTGTRDFDLSGHHLHDGSNSGSRYAFPDGTLLGPGQYYVVFASEVASAPTDCEYGVASGFLGLNDDSPESVSIRNPEGFVVAQVSFDDAPEGASLALSPDGNVDGGYTPSTASPCAVEVSLPVELTDFTALSLGDAVRLDWSTSGERDNAGFLLERSKAGRVFDSIAWVPAGGDHYHYIDRDPFPGQNLYRLRQRDLDGKETIFGPVLVRTDSGAVRVFPNPVAGKLRLSGEVEPGERVTVHAADGRLLTAFSGPEANLRWLPSGVYYLRLRRSSGVESLRFIKE